MIFQTRDGAAHERHLRPITRPRFEALAPRQMLAKMERAKPGPKVTEVMSRAGTKFRQWLKEIGLDKNRAMDGAIPTPEALHKVFKEAATWRPRRARSAQLAPARLSLQKNLRRGPSGAYSLHAGPFAFPRL